MWCGVQAQKPDPSIVGVLPVAVAKKHTVGSGAPGDPKMNMFEHELWLVIRVRNDGPSAATVGVGRISGCATLPLDLAQVLFDQPMDGRNFFEVQAEAEEKWGHARQKVLLAGLPVVAGELKGNSAETVAVPFAVPVQWAGIASDELQATVAVDGNCDAPGVTVNGDPSARQLFELGQFRDETGVHPSPKALGPDFATGALRIELDLGNETVVARPETLKPLKRVPADRWNPSRAAELYENPNSAYLPRER
jgi:hypothetical protein